MRISPEINFQENKIYLKEISAISLHNSGQLSNHWREKDGWREKDSKKTAEENY